jgi:hypothetical protein
MQKELQNVEGRLTEHRAYARAPDLHGSAGENDSRLDHSPLRMIMRIVLSLVARNVAVG